MAKTQNDDDRSLAKWMSEKTDLHPGLTITTMDGKNVTIHSPYYFGDDFVAGSFVEGNHSDTIALSYNAIASVRPLPRRF
jgi:hypothetical protein